MEARAAGRRRILNRLALSLLLAATAATAAPGVETLVPLQQRLGPVRENLALLGRAVVVFIGRFPRAIDDDWAAALCRDPALAEIADRVVFVRHRRSRVLDADELWLRRHGVPAAWAFEGVLIVDLRGRPVATLPRPVAAETLRARVREALEVQPAGETRRFVHGAPPPYALEVPERCVVLAVGEREADLRLWDPERRAELTLRGERVGARGARGEAAALDAMGRWRARLRVRWPQAAHGPLGAGGPSAEAWWVPDGRGARLEAAFVRGGDLFILSVHSRRSPPAALRAWAAEIVDALASGSAEDGTEAQKGG
ncbi:MAG: hypothetical protein D6776_10650 [Planctomycetota bacterium]|nr:MAG: hypothetical protein D6776_10650 [Planctomycetota bacterium]